VKILVLLLLTLSSLKITAAYAMGQRLPQIQDESLSDVKVLASFRLRASDGSTLQFLTEQDRTKDIQKILPAEKKANYKLCRPGHVLNDRLFIPLTTLALDLLQRPRALTASEVALIERTPRCEYYQPTLNLIASSLGGATHPSENLKSLSLVIDKKSGNSLVLNTKSGKKALFKIASNLEGIQNTRDLDRILVFANQSGQSFGIKFSLADIQDLDPNDSTRQEPCDYTRTIKECHSQSESCEYITITEPGYRDVAISSQSTAYTLNMQIVDSLGRTVLNGKAFDFSSRSDSNKGLCYPAGHY
jgi:hypothetical protein